MKRFPAKTLLVYSFISVSLMSCGQGSVPGLRGTTSETISSGNEIHVQGELSAQSVSGPSSIVNFKGDVNGSLSVRKLKNVPEVPPVAEVHSSFIMHDVISKTPVGAWQVKTNLKKLDGAAKLKLQGDSTLSVQSVKESVTEVFVRNDDTGEVNVVGTFPGQSEVVLDDFGDLVRERMDKTNGSAVNLTYFAYSAPLSDYKATCESEGGELMEPQQYCSFRNKKLTAPSIKAQSVAGMRVVSWNLGNVAQSCGTASLGANYNYKLCYTSTERRISDQLLAFEQTGKPAVIFFQEVWHGDCRYTSESWYGTYINQRLCASTVSGNNLNALARILGGRYNYACTPTENVPADQLVVNGYECVAVDPNQMRLNSSAPGGLMGSFHPACAPVDMAHNYMGRDTGYFYLNAVPVGSNSNVLLTTAHLAGIPNNDCRRTQLASLQGSQPFVNAGYAIYAGDWNTDPMADGDPVSPQMRTTFSGVWGGTGYPLGNEIDNPYEPTAFYTWGTNNLDHVFARGFSGSCVRGPNFDGTDHTFTDCRLSSLMN